MNTNILKEVFSNVVVLVEAMSATFFEVIAYWCFYITKTNYIIGLLFMIFGIIFFIDIIIKIINERKGVKQ